MSYQAFWETVIEGYLLRAGFNLEKLTRLIGVRPFFQDAVVSYIILLDLDYNSMFCDCSCEEGIVLDGTSLSYKSLQSFLQQVWRVPMAGSDTKPQIPSSHLQLLTKLGSRAEALLSRFLVFLLIVFY